MPNVTVQLSKQAYRYARIWCAKHETNISRTVREILETLPRISAAKLHAVRNGVDPRACSTAARHQVAAPAPAPTQPHAAPARNLSVLPSPSPAMAQAAPRKISRKPAASR
ncbi:MAG TPA: hypothetical protein VGR47_18520 [Terracidiphilus sp.]|nr:hypothetical protein [Terracidiphilus sp.]